MPEKHLQDPLLLEARGLSAAVDVLALYRTRISGHKVWVKRLG